MSSRESTETALEPALSAYDKRVLAALDEWTMGRAADLDWRTAWAVAERVQDDDVAGVRRILDGLERFGYVARRGWGKKVEYVGCPWRRESFVRAQSLDQQLVREPI
jgi:hypothetical protein